MRVDTGIGGVLALVECLNEVQRHLGRVAELAVAVYLQRGQVVELGRLLLAFLLFHLGDGKWLALDGAEGFLAFLLRGELALSSRKCGVAIDGSQHPVGLGLEIVYLFLTVDDECQGRGLHTTDGQHLAVLPVLQRIETRAVHAQQPVADGTAQTG